MKIDLRDVTLSEIRITSGDISFVITGGMTDQSEKAFKELCDCAGEEFDSLSLLFIEDEDKEAP